MPNIQGAKITHRLTPVNKEPNLNLNSNLESARNTNIAKRQLNDTSLSDSPEMKEKEIKVDDAVATQKAIDEIAELRDGND